MSKGLADSDFLLRFEATSDPWERSKLVGQRISELRRSFTEMTEEQRLELSKQGESELKIGLELLGADKRTVMQLLELVDPPPAAP